MPVVLTTSLVLLDLVQLATALQVLPVVSRVLMTPRGWLGTLLVFLQMNLVLGIAMLLLARTCVNVWATCIRRPLVHPVLPLTRTVLTNGYKVTSFEFILVVPVIVGNVVIRVTVL